MRRIGPLLMSTVLVTGCAGLAANNESVRSVLVRSGQSQPKLSAYDQGKRYLQFRSAGLAVELFQQALKEHPDSVEALNGLAVAYDRLGRPDVAQKYLDQALALDSESPVTLNNLAYLNLVQGNTAVALAYAEHAQMAADVPMEMMLPDTIAKAVSRNAAAATQLAANEQQARTVVEAPAAPAESNIRRVGLNEWELRISPLAPSNALQIFPPGTAPRVIQPSVEPVTTPIPIESISESPVQGSDIPDTVMDLLDVSSAPVISLAESVPTEPPVTAVLAYADPAVALTALAPEQPVAEEGRVDNPPTEHEPSIPAFPTPDSLATLPPQPLPQPLRSEQVVASLPPPEFRTRVLPGSLVAAPSVPVQPLPEPARVESVIASLPTPEYRTQTLPSLSVTTPAITAQPLPEPARVESVIASLPMPEFETQALPSLSVATPTITAHTLPEPARVESVIASLPMPEYRTQTLASLSVATPPVTAQPLPEPARVDSVIASLPMPEYRTQTLPSLSVTTSSITAQPLPEPARMESVIASLPMPEYRTQALASLSVTTPPITAQLLPEPVVVESVIASVRAPQPLPATLPEPAVQSTPRASAPQTPTPATQHPVERAAVASGAKADWHAYVPQGTLVRVSNGTGRRLMATRFARYFSEHGLSVRRVANANSFDYKRTTIFYNPDQRDYAYALAQVLPFPVRLIEAKQGRGQVELILGSDLLGFDDSIRSA